MKLNALLAAATVASLSLILSSGGADTIAAELQVAQVRTLAPSPISPKPVQLFDLTTKQNIGYVDSATKSLVFNSRAIRIPMSGIKKCSSRQDYDCLMQKFGYAPATEQCTSRLRYMDLNIPKMQPISISGYGSPGSISIPGDTTKGASACASLCWYMSEGGAMCQGCCTDVGGGYCSCWEFCSDFASSSGPLR